jgi:hypothetical protein
MATRYINRAAGTGLMWPALPGAVPIQYDSDDDLLKFLDDDGTTVRSLVTTAQTQTLTNKTLTTPVIDGVTYSANNDRQIITEAFAVDGAALHAAVLPAVVFPAAAIILRAILDITTVATGACTIDVGYTAVSGTTSSDTLLDGVDANAAVATFDSMNYGLDSGANALAQKAASGKWVTIDEKTGDSTGMVAVLYVQYILA